MPDQLTPIGGRVTVLLLVLLMGPAAAAQDEPDNGRRVVEAVRLQPGEAVRLDGRLDEPAWSRAIPASGFIQRDPDNGRPATERTEVRVLFDQQRLYLGVICFDSEPHNLLGNQMQRDAALTGDDRFMWTIDPYLDGTSGYYFETNPAGLMGDGVIVRQGGGYAVSQDWDGIWNVRVQRTEEGWVAEVEIPFRTMNFDPGAPAWGINFQRTVRRKNEESLWMGYQRNRSLHWMSNAGLLRGIEGISQGFGLDFKPYVVGRATRAPADGQLHNVRTADVGADFFYNLSPSLRANFTVNTDFAETEVDQRIVNLTRFPQRFPEKRAFFLEGGSFFVFAPIQADPFFSRRIGLNETTGERQAIDYGVKLTGQAGPMDLGLLQVRTAPLRDLSGEDFTVLRPKLRFLRQSYVGGFFTRRAPREGLEPDRHVVGTDFALTTSQFLGSKNMEIAGYFLWNNNPLGTGDSSSFGFRQQYNNDPWNFQVSWRELQENYDPSLGFTQRTGIRRLRPAFSYSPRPSQHPWIRSFSFGAILELVTDLENVVETRNFDFTLFEATLHSGDLVRFTLHPHFERLVQDFRIHPGVVLPAGGEYGFTRYRIRAETAPQRSVAVNAEYALGNFLSGDRTEYLLALNLRPRRGLQVGLEGEWNRVELFEGNFSTSLVRSTVRAQFSPWVSLGNLLQYDTVTRSLGWQARLRWTLRAGNDFFFVYTHNWLDDFERFTTQNRQAAAKASYTHSF